MPPLITLDRIVSMEPGKGAKALRNVPTTLAIFDTHFPRKPVLPGVLIIGSIGELAGMLLREQTGRAWKLGGLSRVSFRHFVQPGDQMEISVDVKDVGDTAAILTASVKVDGKAVTTIRQVRMIPA